LGFADYIAIIIKFKT